MSLQFVVGGGERERLVVFVLGYECPDSTDADDGNWLSSRVTICVGGFEGAMGCSLRTEEFERFSRELACLREELGGVAEFDSMEQQLRFRMTGDGLGHFEVVGELRDRAGDGNRLEWQLHVDQTQIAQVLSEVDALMERFPVRGR